MSEAHHKRELHPEEVRIPSDSVWAKLPVGFGLLGLVGLVLAVVLGGDDKREFYASYLIAVVFFASIGLGGLFFVLVHYATRAGWSVAVRRLAENTASSLPVVALLFLPLLLIGVDEIYEWAHFEHALEAAEAGESGHGDGEGSAEHGDAHGDEVHAAAHAGEHGEHGDDAHGDSAHGEHGGGGHGLAGLTADEMRAHDPVLAGKMGYLNTGFWRVRAVFYLAVWCFLAWFFRRSSVGQDAAGELATTRRLQSVSAPGLIAFALTLTFAAFDWLMSLDPHWFSTIFGVYFFAGCLICIYAFLSVMGITMRKAGLLDDVITKEHYHDLGKLLFAFTVFWTYIAFSQYMLIWYANLPEETIWFHHRWAGSWKYVSILIGVGHFAVPFFFLMSRHIKRHPALLTAGALWMLAMHYVDLHWLVGPNFHPEGPSFGLVDVLLLVGVGGLFLAAFTWFLRKDALVPVKDPRLNESLAFENF